MPCNSQYMEPTEQEKESKKVAGMLLRLREAGIDPMIEDHKENDLKLFDNKNYLKKVANDPYGDKDQCDALTAQLCATCHYLEMNETTKAQELIYDGRDREARKLADWWEDHQEYDKKKQEEEEEAKLKQTFEWWKNTQKQGGDLINPFIKHMVNYVGANIDDVIDSYLED